MAVAAENEAAARAGIDGDVEEAAAFGTQSVIEFGKGRGIGFVFDEDRMLRQVLQSSAHIE